MEMLRKIASNVEHFMLENCAMNAEEKTAPSNGNGHPFTLYSNKSKKELFGIISTIRNGWQRQTEKNSVQRKILLNHFVWYFNQYEIKSIIIVGIYIYHFQLSSEHKILAKIDSLFWIFAQLFACRANTASY